MYDLDRPRRRNRSLLAVSIVLCAGTLILIVLGYRGLPGWLVLLSAFVNLISAIATRRALARVSPPATHRDAAG